MGTAPEGGRRESDGEMCKFSFDHFPSQRHSEQLGAMIR